MTKFLFSRGPSILGVSLASFVFALAASPALADSQPSLTPIDTSACTTPLFSQPFQSEKDSNWYVPVPLDAPGWTLSGGAHLISAVNQNGDTGIVLDLPTGASAVSPTICVDSGYPKARARIRDAMGDGDVSFAVSYAGTKTWNAPQETGHVHGEKAAWRLAEPVDLHPGNHPGWQLVRFIFTAGGHADHGHASEFQLYDFAVDPHMSH